jgi:hypothetical protein
MGIEDDTQILIPENITVNLGLLQILVNGNSLNGKMNFFSHR